MARSLLMRAPDMSPAIEAALTYRDDALAFLSPAPLVCSGVVRSGVVCSGVVFSGEERTLTRTLSLDDLPRAWNDGFGLLEPGQGGWTLCIPDGADAEATLRGLPIDLAKLALEPSGERRLPVCEGLSARVLMGEFRFEVRPAA